MRRKEGRSQVKLRNFTDMDDVLFVVFVVVVFVVWTRSDEDEDSSESIMVITASVVSEL
jgi:hypothetical protein